SMRRLLTFVVALFTSVTIPAAYAVTSDTDWRNLTRGFGLYNFPDEFRRAPPEPPAYMVDNTGNLRGVAPSKGKYNGAVWSESGSFEGYMEKLTKKKKKVAAGNTLTSNDKDDTYWLTLLGPHGKAPLAEADYVFYRNVLDYGADNTGSSNTEEAINAAIIDGNRCGVDCGSTTVRPALIYFPPGTYKICTPIIQYYFTQFVGNPNDRPIIKGCDSFTGIALLDVNPYIPGSGINWYISQNQFFRQIRNFVFDLTSMPAATDENGQPLVPTGIHWQVSQASSLQSLLFLMPKAEDLGGKPPTHVGIFTENGSGGFVSDLVFEGGAIGWRVGSQQYTATSLQFRNCSTAVDMIWDWGFNWHKIEIDGGSIGFNISGNGGLNDQGVGSVSIIDSTVKNVLIGLLAAPRAANVVLDNTAFTNVGTIMVMTGTNDAVIEGTNGTKELTLWEYGKHYIHNQGGSSIGERIDDRPRPAALLDSNGKLFTRLRPQYENLTSSSFLVATDEGCFNNGTGDNTDAVNAFLKKALDAKHVAYFPSGIYLVQGTVTFPTGSQIQGSGWSQIQATGSYFSDMANPKVVVLVGEPGDVGTMEIADMLFGTKGATAGAIMMEWNVHESSQGAAALWDSHIRIGGAAGTDLDSAACPKFSQNEACIGASLLLHITKDASGYFENFWAWVADHDIDMSLPREMNSSKSQISVFGARGILIESQGPVWLYGTGSEHLIFYQYQLLNAKNVYLGHVQTESPYFQPVPVAPSPMDKALGVFSEDPNWADCQTDACMAWGLRIIDAEKVIVHGAGLYSFFNNFSQTCTSTESCQERIMEVRGSKDISIFNIFTKGVIEIATDSSIELADNNQHGFTSEISVWFPEDSQSAEGGESLDENIVYVGPEVYKNHTVQCPSPPCILVMPPTTLASPTTIYIDPYTTELEVGQSQNGTFSATTTTVTITVASIVTSVIPVANYNYTGEESEGAPLWVTPSIDLPPTPIVLTKPNGVVTTRTLTLPPWPQITLASDSANAATSSSISIPTIHTVTFTGAWDSSLGTAAPTYTMTFTDDLAPMTIPCPLPERMYVPAQSVYVRFPDLACPPDVESKTIPWACTPTATLWLAAPTTVGFDFGCVHWSGIGDNLTTYSEFPTGVYIELLQNKPNDKDDNGTTHCDGFYVFWICIPFPGIKIDLSWVRLHFPIPGPFIIIGTPPIKFPEIPGLTINLPKLPGPWPPLTIDPVGKPVEPQTDPTECETQEAEVCATSTFISTTVIDSLSSTSTITSSATTECNTISACVIIETDQDTTSFTGDSCALPTQDAGNLLRRISDNYTTAPTEHQNANHFEQLMDKQPPKVGHDHAMIWPENPGDSEEVGKITDWLKATTGGDGRGTYGDYKELRANGFGDDGSDWVIVIFVEDMLKCHIDALRDKFRWEIHCIYGIYKRNSETFGVPVVNFDAKKETNARQGHAKQGNATESASKRSQIQRRNSKMLQSEYWELSQISVAPGESWFASLQSEWPDTMYYPVQDSFGEGQTVFIAENGLWNKHSELRNNWEGYSRPPITYLPGLEWGKDDLFRSDPRSEDYIYDLSHGTGVTSKVVGWELGLAKKAQVVLAGTEYAYARDWLNNIYEREMEKVVRVYNKVKQDYAEDLSRRGTYIFMTTYTVDGALGLGLINTCPIWRSRWRDLTDKLINELDVVVVQTCHNNHREFGDNMYALPPAWCEPQQPDYIDSLICVGGVDAVGRVGSHSPYTRELVNAPSFMINAAVRQGGIDGDVIGNSFSTPLIAGLVAYWRGLQGIKNGWDVELRKPANVKKLLLYMQRPLDPTNLAKGLDKTKVYINPDRDYMRGPDPPLVPFIWTGEFKGKNCLTDPDIHDRCPKGRLADLQPFGAGCDQYTSGTCVASASKSPPTNTPGPGALSDPITFSTGPATITCAPGSPGCGSVCTGHYCGSTVPSSSSTDLPPDHYDPENPTSPKHTVTAIATATYAITVSVTQGHSGSMETETSTGTQEIGQTTSMATVTQQVTLTTFVATSTKTPDPSVSEAPATTNVAPSLTVNPLLFTGTECAGYTSTKICPESDVCIDGEWCLPTQPPCPQWQDVGAPLCPSNKPSCTSLHLTTSCAAKQLRQIAPSTSTPTST
ncbi:glucan 1,3-beta-glucosidase, partial [Triangularia verruculosa]